LTQKLLAVIVAGFIGGQAASGQISGTVKDSSGKPAASMTVAVISTERNISRTVVTDVDGLYRITSLTPGSYLLEVRQGDAVRARRGRQEGHDRSVAQHGDSQSDVRQRGPCRPRRRRQRVQREGSIAGLGQQPTYDTQLTPEQERAYQAWKLQNAPRDSGADYDLRGAFQAGLSPDPQSGHWPDTFKKPGHPTFSNQSQYAAARPDLAGSWQGENFIPPVAPSGAEMFRGAVIPASKGFQHETGPAPIDDTGQVYAPNLPPQPSSRTTNPAIPSRSPKLSPRLRPNRGCPRKRCG